jgi:hypothetical protein
MNILCIKCLAFNSKKAKFCFSCGSQIAGTTKCFTRHHHLFKLYDVDGNLICKCWPIVPCYRIKVFFGLITEIHYKLDSPDFLEIVSNAGIKVREYAKKNNLTYIADLCRDIYA